MGKEWTGWTKWTEKEKDNLIKILESANAQKDAIINQQASELVFAHKRIMNRESLIEVIRELVSDETA